ncbi:MAG: hypothetical protein FWF56_05610 [Firmicutes bacterium]|nr:hypothetical protein [Bacillota bacterium]MCL1953715.1 hypothetical protein [Bacillota bacterium]
MLLDKSGKLVKTLDFRGTKIEFLDKISAKDLFGVITAALEAVNIRERFKANELVPKDWIKTPFEPILNACADEHGTINAESQKHARRLFGVIIKQALIMTPLLFRQKGSDNDFEAILYVRESLLA